MKPPRFWSGIIDPRGREAAPLTRFLLTPLALIYAAVTARRIARTEPAKVDAIVICVGNLSVGGTGKSPVVSALRSYLTETRSLRVASLSRGYGGALKGPLRVDLDQHCPGDVGDEPLMLAQRGESWIGADRGAAGAAMSEAGVEVIIMDDGHQNPGLFKDLSLIVMDSEDPIGNGYVIPKGPLREPVKTGLARADAIVLMGTGDVPSFLEGSGLPILRATLEPVAAAPSGPLVAFAGIGRPEKFFDTLKALKADIADAVPFPDHHVYSSSDLRYLRQLAADNKAQLITTEKDFARLGPQDRKDIAVLPVEAAFDSMALLDSLLSSVLKQPTP